MGNPPPSDLYLFEASWEVCNKVGGIHTVLTTKLRYALAEFPGRYVAVGPYLKPSPRVFRELNPPEPWRSLRDELRERGIDLHYGFWQTGQRQETPCILLGWERLTDQLNTYKGQFWERFQLDTLHSDFYEIDTPLLWSIAVGHLVQAFVRHTNQATLFHGHEWLSAGAFLVLSDHSEVKTIFTTHATVLGRALAGSGELNYHELGTIDPMAAAQRHGVGTKHYLEALAATLATAFTTVSHLTAREATAFLKRTPDMLTENGLDTDQFPDFDQLAVRRPAARECLDAFVERHFFPAYRFDLKHTRYHCTLGRSELHNKGYDLYLSALGALNRELTASESAETLITFFFVAGQHEGIDTTPASLTPFRIKDPAHDLILQAAEAAGLHNHPEDRVKIVYISAYLDGSDGIFNQPLYNLIAGCDLGVFPSAYEPWGYAPMESLAMGVPCVTTDLAGFGLAVRKRSDQGNMAVTVLERENQADTVAAHTLTGIIQNTLTLPPRKQLLHRMVAYQLIQQFDWSRLYDRYRETYQLARSRS